MNQIVYLEIPAPQFERTLKFYETVFGWEIKVEDDGQYAVFKTGNFEGGFDYRKKPSRDGVVLYLKTPDMHSHLGTIVSSGGNVVKPKTMISQEYGFEALFTDPSGNLMGLWSPE